MPDTLPWGGVKKVLKHSLTPQASLGALFPPRFLTTDMHLPISLASSRSCSSSLRASRELWRMPAATTTRVSTGVGCRLVLPRQAGVGKNMQLVFPPFLTPNLNWHTLHHQMFYQSLPPENIWSTCLCPHESKLQWRVSFWNGNIDDLNARLMKGSPAAEYLYRKGKERNCSEL